ncbi:peptidase [uncultured Mycobacterium sp.]|uniref:peptidase n=1 Tax=uncultured Mycobacterium sp. TaxID=171292 RepID=UPI0035CA252C
MSFRGQHRRLRRGRSSRWLSVVSTAMAGTFAAMLAASCATVADGRATSVLYDPFHVGGLPAVDGPSGPKEDAPPPTGKVLNTDGGAADKLALLSVNDVEEFWTQTYSGTFKGSFTPIDTLVSYDSRDPASPMICGDETYHEANAFYCRARNLMAWDRGVLVPTGQRYFGDMSIPALIAHEYGHAVQRMAHLTNRKTPTVVAEQQADCFAGAYMRWVAEGHSPRFRVSTGDGLDHVLAGAITIRDPIVTPEDSDMVEEGHGTALDRVSAFQMGFIRDPGACGGIDMDELKNRRGDLPISLQADPAGDVETGEVPITQDTVSTLAEVLGIIFSPKQNPTVSFEPTHCGDANGKPPVSYCPSTNTLSVDMAALKKMGASANERDYVLPQGDDTALSVVMSRYVLELQHERGLPLDTATAALRTACLTGVAHRKMAVPVKSASGQSLSLTAGDLDEAVAGLLTNGLVASDVNGVTVPAGFTRIAAFRSGVLGDEEPCFERFNENGSGM